MQRRPVYLIITPDCRIAVQFAILDYDEAVSLAAIQGDGCVVTTLRWYAQKTGIIPDLPVLPRE